MGARSFVAAPNIVASGTTVSFNLSGTLTTWDGTTVFTILGSGGAVGALLSTTVVNATTAILSVAVSGTPGSLTIGDGTSTTTAIVTAAASAPSTTRAFGSTVVQDTYGNLLAGSVIDLLDPATGARLTETVYADATSAATLTLPFVTKTGRVVFFLTHGRLVLVKATLGQRVATEEIAVVDPTQ